jgi:predicted amidohydrolase
MPLHDALLRVTVNPAETVCMPGRIGTLRAGAEADAVVLDPREGRFDFVDSHEITRVGDLKLTPTTVVKGGQVVHTAA